MTIVAPFRRQETAIGLLRRPWVYSGFTMSTYQRYARVLKSAVATEQLALGPGNACKNSSTEIMTPSSIAGKFPHWGND
ncbi:hypothetical protein ColTof4_01633 [Colletotrichum tofieldiae]|nr:hypothetical protein ColTof3_10085 [Colletotrichum tofieldiae]GKT69210.1 hypothetical protein ColTof4_01633 [Colletotrichum tofieldiae]GKT96493.1 hypothetical protein Ct61P_14343 [Colletotrichum tofieldiae]